MLTKELVKNSTNSKFKIRK